MEVNPPPPPAKPKMTWLYHETKAPKGQIFKLEMGQDKHEALLDEGWVDTPAGFKPVEANKGDAPAVVPGKEVPEKTLADFSDVDILNELVTRNILPAPTKDELIAYCEEYGIALAVNGLSSDKEPLMNRFYQSPTSLTKEELIILGNERGISLRMNMNEKTMIDRITETLNLGNQE